MVPGGLGPEPVPPPLGRTYTLRFTPALVRRAVNRYWARTLGRMYPVALLGLGVGLGALIWQGDRSWYVGILGTVLVLAAVFAVALYVVHARRAFGVFRRLADGRVTLRLGPEGFGVESAAGRSDLPWSAVTEIWRYDDLWLLVFSKAVYVTLPIGEIDGEGRRFFAGQVERAGGKIR
jgi:hypothetical protein